MSGLSTPIPSELLKVNLQERMFVLLDAQRDVIDAAVALNDEPLISAIVDQVRQTAKLIDTRW